MMLRHAIAISSLAALAALAFQWPCAAHEGHAALPSTGVIVDGNQLLISPAAAKAIAMETATIRLGDVEHTLRVNARTELPWSGRAKVTTLTDGKIETVLVKPGERVEAGQVLARVASLELETLQTELLQSAARVAMLERLIASREDLVARGVIRGQDLLDSKAELQQVRALREIGLRKLQALGLERDALGQLLDSGETVATIPVVSPIAGVVEHADARRGQLIAATDHLFDVVDQSSLYVVGNVLEGDAYQVQEGMPTTITFAGLPDNGFTGRIARLRMKMAEATRSLEAVVALDNAEELLRPGMFGRMAIEVAAARQEIVCPTSALVETDSGTVVLRREAEGKFSRRPVEIGMRSPELAVIKSGLFPGQQVISRGTQLLAAMFDSAAKPAPGSARDSQKPAPETSTSAPPAFADTERILAAKATVEIPTNQMALATSLIEGRVAGISVGPGEAVNAGQVLAQVQSQQLRNVQLELLQTAARLRRAQNQFEWVRPLAESGKKSKRELWELELEAKTLAQQADSLKRRLALIGLPQRDIDRLQSDEPMDAGSGSAISGTIAVRAPISGRVADIDLMLGEIVHAHDDLFEIQDTTTVWIKALVLERHAARIRVGQSAAVTFPSHPNLRVSGHIVRMAPQLTSRERVLPVWIEATNTDGFLKGGMLARVEISVPQLQPLTARTAQSK